jgi:hypothetical protein
MTLAELEVRAGKKLGTLTAKECNELEAKLIMEGAENHE